MKAEQLVSLAAPRGVDLVSAAQSETALPKRADVRVRMRHGQRVVTLLEQSESRAYGKATRAMVEAEWSPAELGQAAAGIPEVPFLAACFAWAGASQHRWRLHDELHRHALQMRRAFSWPVQVPGYDGRPRHYLEHLCSLVLDMDAHPSVFQLQPCWRPEENRQTEDPPSMEAIYLEVSQSVWSGRLAERFGQVRSVWLEWLDQAARRIQARLREDD